MKCLFLFSTSHKDQENHHFTNEFLTVLFSDNGVSWPENVESCNGDRQSPIDIQTTLASLISHPKIDFAFEGQCLKSALI